MTRVLSLALASSVVANVALAIALWGADRHEPDGANGATQHRAAASLASRADSPSSSTTPAAGAAPPADRPGDCRACEEALRAATAHIATLSAEAARHQQDELVAVFEGGDDDPALAAVVARLVPAAEAVVCHDVVCRYRVPGDGEALQRRLDEALADPCRQAFVAREALGPGAGGAAEVTVRVDDEKTIDGAALLQHALRLQSTAIRAACALGDAPAEVSARVDAAGDVTVSGVAGVDDDQARCVSAAVRAKGPRCPVPVRPAEASVALLPAAPAP